MSNKNKQNETIAEAIYDLSKSLRLLGNGNIARDDTKAPGAIEGLAIKIEKSNQAIASSLDDMAEAIRELSHAIADKDFVEK